MAHKGRSYPYFRPSELLSSTNAFNGLAGIEYNWGVTSWGGIASTGLAPSGRGCIAIGYTQGKQHADWKVQVGSFLGSSLYLGFRIGFTPSIGLTQATGATLWGATVQAVSAPVNISTAFGMSSFAFPDIMSPVTAFPVLTCDILIQFETYDWTQPAPPPPLLPQWL